MTGVTFTARTGSWRAAVVITLAMMLPAVAANAADSPLERGAYLVRGIAACGNCHTPKLAGQGLAEQELSGGVVFDEPAFHAVAPNITPDLETGIGAWTDQQIINSIRNGKRPDGTTIGPPMPISFYRGLSDTDTLAVVAYLRSIKPVSHQVEKSGYRIPLPETYGPPVTKVAELPGGNKIAQGEYLAAAGHCMACHTPMVNGRLDMSRLGAGGRDFPLPTVGSEPSVGVVRTSNLTPANPDGIANWTDAQVKTAITTGVRPDGRHLVRLMAFDWYKNVAPDDLDALVAYLRTLRPAEP